MFKDRLTNIAIGLIVVIAAQTSAFADVVYAAYNGSQLGVTVRDTTLNQISYFNTGISAAAIAAGPNNDVYLISGNHIYNYKANGALIADMTFPDPGIIYTSVAVSGNRVYASYKGSQHGVTVRDLNLRQLSYFDTGIAASGIAVGAKKDLYLTAGNHVYNYSTKGALVADMTFPDPGIVYTSVAVSGNRVYASYKGAQQGVTVRDLNLHQLSYFETGIDASGLSVGPKNDLYLAAGNHLYHYTNTGALIADMTFPIDTINYTDVIYK